MTRRSRKTMENLNVEESDLLLEEELEEETKTLVEMEPEPEPEPPQDAIEVVENLEIETVEISEKVEEQVKQQPTGKIFLEEEDKRLLRKFNSHIVNKLGLHKTRSVRV